MNADSHPSRDVPLCKDCAYYHNNLPQRADGTRMLFGCAAPPTIHDLVTGEQIYKPCHHMRMSYEPCSAEGKLFMARQPEPTRTITVLKGGVHQQYGLPNSLFAGTVTSATPPDDSAASVRPKYHLNQRVEISADGRRAVVGGMHEFVPEISGHQQMPKYLLMLIDPQTDETYTPIRLEWRFESELAAARRIEAEAGEGV